MQIQKVPLFRYVEQIFQYVNHRDHFSTNRNYDFYEKFIAVTRLIHLFVIINVTSHS